MSEYNDWTDQAIKRQIRTHKNDIEQFEIKKRGIDYQIQARLEAISRLQEEVDDRRALEVE